MKTASAFSRFEASRWSRVLLLVALCALVGLAQAPGPALAQTSNSCTSDADCHGGTHCCRACGFPGCTAKACLHFINGHCPAIP
jgi:hypothetical protein